MRWLPLDEAHELVTRATDREVLERFARRPPLTGLGAAAPPRERRQPRRSGRGTTRCARSTRRARSRPRSWCGCSRASASRRSSRPTTCAASQTVRAAERGDRRAVREEPLLSERGFPGHEEEAVELMRNLGRPGGAAVACSQRDVIPELVARLAADEDGGARGSGSDLSVQEGRRLGAQLLRPQAVGAEAFPPPKTARNDPGPAVSRRLAANLSRERAHGARLVADRPHRARGEPRRRAADPGARLSVPTGPTP